MKTMNVSPLSFGQVYVHDPMNKFQRKKADELAEQIKKTVAYSDLEKSGIDVNIKVSPDRGKIFNRNLLAVYYTQGKVNEYSNYWFKKEKEIFEESGDSKTLLKKVNEFSYKVWDKNRDTKRKINDAETRALLENLDKEKIVVWHKSNMSDNTGAVIRYYDKEKKCVFDITKVSFSNPEREEYHHSTSHEGYEYNEEKNSIFLDGICNNGNKFHKEYPLNLPRSYTYTEYYPNGTVAKKCRQDGDSTFETKFDSKGRKTYYYAAEYGIYITEASYDPETGKVINSKVETL